MGTYCRAQILLGRAEKQTVTASALSGCYDSAKTNSQSPSKEMKYCPSGGTRYWFRNGPEPDVSFGDYISDRFNPLMA